MDKSKLIKPAVIAAVSVGVAITAPHLAPFLVFPLKDLIGEVFSTEELEKPDSIGKITVSAISGVLTNIASAAIWESKNIFNSQQNEDLSRALAKTYQKSLEQIENQINESKEVILKEQAKKLLPSIQARISRTLKVNTEEALVELFPLQKEEENVVQPIEKTFSNRITSEKFILDISDESISNKQFLADEIEITLRRWLNEEKINQQSQIALGLNTNEKLPEPLNAFLRDNLSEILPHYLGQILKSPDLQDSWIAFQRSHLQALLAETRKNRTLTEENKSLILPLAEKLDALAKGEVFSKLLAENTAEVLRRSNESEENIKQFVSLQAIQLHKLLSGMEERLSEKIDISSARIIDAVSQYKLKSDSPRVVGRLIEESLFVDRIEERENLFQLMTQNAKKAVILKAASGFGKTSLAMEVLHKLTPDERRLDERFDALLIFLFREGEGTFREICRKTDKRLDKKDNSFTNRYELFTRQTQQSPETLPIEIIKDVIEELSQLGNIWLVFDNFETVLSNDIIENRHLKAFFENALQVKGLHFLITSQKVPEFKSRIDTETIEIGDLPDAFALEFLKIEGSKLKASGEQVDCGLAEVTEEDVYKLKELGFKFVPMALVALVGYLKASYKKYGTTLKDVLNDEELFAKFRNYDAREGAMYLLQRQFLALSYKERLILKAVSIFPQAIQFPLLVEVLSEHLDEDSIYRVLTSNTLIRRIGANFYELLPQAKEVISDQSDNKDELMTRQLLNLRAAAYYKATSQPIEVCETQEEIAAHLNVIDHLIQAQHYDEALSVLYNIEDKLINLGYLKELVNRCQHLDINLTNLKNKAINYRIWIYALNNLRRLDEALEKIVDAIEILELIVKENKDEEIFSLLISAYIDRAAMLLNYGEVEISVYEFNKVIELIKPLVQGKEPKLLLSLLLGGCYVNKANGLAILRNENESLKELNNAIEIFELHSRDSESIEDSLASSYIGMGRVLARLDKLDEAIEVLQKAVKIRERLAAKDNSINVKDKLAKAYFNLGLLIAKSANIPLALINYDKALVISEWLVNEKKCDEFSSELARTYGNIGCLFNIISNPAQAICSLDKALYYYEKCLANGERHILPDYFVYLVNIIKAYIKLKKWEHTAQYLVMAFEYEYIFQVPTVPKYAKQTIANCMGDIIQNLKELSVEEREKIFAYTGNWTERFRWEMCYDSEN